MPHRGSFLLLTFLTGLAGILPAAFGRGATEEGKTIER
jgi:hypothetical protein